MTYNISKESDVVPASKTIVGKEPAFWTSLVQGVLIVLIAFGLPLTETQTGSIIALVNAVMGVVLAIMVRPINVAVFTTLAQAAITLAVTFGFDMSQQEIGSITGVLGILLSLAVVRPQVVPLATLRAGQVETQPHLPSGV